MASRPPYIAERNEVRSVQLIAPRGIDAGCVNAALSCELREGDVRADAPDCG